ncbi:fluoride efflux transporter CrcB [Saccharomonospora cyanea]|uniref:Fluoride-specific ion channel FluC n=1 Tax=Saccharomonospora cyanea NA-134 TaxID=882082 RepID=H5XMS4_9PSEU|nr:fluoride efflux transporter CrcB [Saccharomonospora cyanea]EHR62049.1 crcB protein [Saccharomonospora cyanea NA-134]
MTVVLVMLGGAVGATLRYLLDTLVRRRQSSRFPWSTLVVNVLGSVVLGMLTGAALPGAAGSASDAALGVGLCGALTTFSTFGYETVRLFLDGAHRTAVANVVVTTAASLSAAAGGVAVGGLLG